MADAAGPQTRELTPDEGAALACLAAWGVAAKLRGLATDGRPPAEARLRALGASFVTLEAAGRLRGCIGTLYPARPLYLDVARNARRAAEDPRLPAVTATDWPRLDVSVSVLTPPRPLAAAGVAELAAALRPGTGRADPAGRPAPRHVPAQGLAQAARPRGLRTGAAGQGWLAGAGVAGGRAGVPVHQRRTSPTPRAARP